MRQLASTRERNRARRGIGVQRKAQIVAAILQLVHQYGVQGTTVARIAAKVGVSEPTLYKYFDSRNAMLIAALDSLFDRAEEVHRLADGVDPLERLRLIAQHHTRETAERKVGFVSPLFELIVGPPETGLRERARERCLRIVDTIESIIEEGKAQGKIKPEVNARRIAWRMMGFYWLEDVASLQGFDEVVEQGISTEAFQDLMDQIATC